MSHLSKLRKRVRYEKSVPRCATCQSFQPSRTYLIDSLPRQSQPYCNQFHFSVRPAGVCDFWQSPDGQQLEAA